MSQIDLEVTRRRVDVAVLALEAWHVISTRTRNCLGHLNRDDDPESTVSRTSIEQMHLSDLSRCSRSSIIRLPNLGHVCYCEIAAAMDRYGWRFHDEWTGGPEPLALELLGPSLARYVKMVSQAAEARAERFALGEKMLELHDRDGWSGAEIGKLFGVSGSAALATIQKVRRTTNLRIRYPLPAPPATN